MSKKICIAGKNDIAVNALHYLIYDLHIPVEYIAVTLNQTDTGQDSWQKSLKAYAQSNRVDILSLKDLYFIEDLVFISLEFDQIVKVQRFSANKLYNIHFSKLPAYKGMYTSVLPILKGEIESGVTLHNIDAGIDTGSIIRQISFPLHLQDTARTLYDKYLHYGLQLFKEEIYTILKDVPVATEQSVFQSSYYSKQEIDFQNIHIDLNKTSFEIHNQLRAFIFPEYQLPCIKGIKIKRSELLLIKKEPRQCVDKNDYFEITGIDGFLIQAYKDHSCR